MLKLIHQSTKLQRRLFHQYFEKFSLGLTAKKTEKRQNIKNIKTVATIENNARDLLKKLTRSKSTRVSLIQLENLVHYMKIYPLARKQVFVEDGTTKLLKIQQKTRCQEIRQLTKIALGLIGHVDPVKGKGVRILSLDGGGTRGVMTLKMLEKISEQCQQPIHELFDLIVGTSTGAIIAFLIGIKKAPVSECREMYRRLSTEIFQANRIVGTGKLFLNHAYYNHIILEDIFKSELSEEICLIDTIKDAGPKVAAISTVVNEPALQPYVFRNYSLKPTLQKTYLGSSKHKAWQALRASTAAPGYFEEYLIDNYVHQDGGLLTNNPCAIAIHEAKHLWPTTPIQAIVSLGTGEYHGHTSPQTQGFTSLREKLMKLVASATDVEAIHTILNDLLPETDYVRLNPNMSIYVGLDESREEYLAQLEKDTQNYIKKFSHKFDKAALVVTKQKHLYHKLKDRAELQLKMHGWL